MKVAGFPEGVRHCMNQRLLPIRPGIRRVDLQFHEERDARNFRQHLGQRGDTLSGKRRIIPAPGIDPRQHIPVDITNRNLPSPDSFQCFVVNHDGNSVPAQLNIELNRVYAVELPCGAKTGHRILREGGRQSPVRDDLAGICAMQEGVFFPLLIFRTHPFLVY